MFDSLTGCRSVPVECSWEIFDRVTGCRSVRVECSCEMFDRLSGCRSVPVEGPWRYPGLCVWVSKCPCRVELRYFRQCEWVSKCKCRGDPGEIMDSLSGCRRVDVDWIKKIDARNFVRYYHEVVTPFSFIITSFDCSWLTMTHHRCNNFWQPIKVKVKVN